MTRYVSIEKLRPPGRPPRPGIARRRAFTLIELLTVIAVIGILAAIIIPVVGAARKKAYQTREVSAARQLLVAYHAYAAESRGILIAGRDNREARYDETGQELTGLDNMAGASWVHPLRPFLGERYRGVLYVNEQADYYDHLVRNGTAAVAYELACFPSFGMNMDFVGGSGALIRDQPVRRVESALLPSKLIAFASGRDRKRDPRCGYFHLYAPKGAWPSADPALAPEDGSRDEQYGFVAFRHNGRAVAAFLDSHIEMLNGAAMRDMRLWSNEARRTDNPNYRPRALE